VSAVPVAPSTGALALTGATRRRLIHRNSWTVSIYVLMLLLLLVEKLVHQSFNSFDMVNLVSTALPLAFAAMAQASIVLIGGIDLSIGQTMALVNVVAVTNMTNASYPHAIIVAVLIVIGTAILYGCVGAVITISRVPDIIVTLATSFIWYGIALRVMPTPGGTVPQEFYNLANGTGPAEIPEALFVLVAALLLIWLPFHRSRLGLSVYALGSNRTAAFLSGISISRTRIIAYAFGGVFAALAGLALTAYTSSGDPNSASSYTLNSVAAVVLGGVSLAGGRGGLSGPVAAAYVLTLIASILTFLSIDPNYSSVIQGAIVVIVVLFAGVLTLRSEH
jgi:ribose transport system permease protein